MAVYLLESIRTITWRKRSLGHKQYVLTAAETRKSEVTSPSDELRPSAGELRLCVWNKTLELLHGRLLFLSTGHGVRPMPAPTYKV
jgi:hypothetical protein